MAVISKECFTELVLQYERLVYTVCFQLVRDAAAAEDLTQDTFLSAYLHREDIPEGYERQWLGYTHRQDCHYKRGHYSDDEACGYPEQAVGPHDGIEELGTSLKTQAGEEQTQADTSKHEVGAAGSVGDHMELRAEAAYEYANHDRATCKAEFYRNGYAGDGDRNRPYDKRQHHANEDCREIRILEVYDRVAEQFLHAVDRTAFADNGKTIAKL